MPTPRCETLYLLRILGWCGDGATCGWRPLAAEQLEACTHPVTG